MMDKKMRAQMYLEYLEGEGYHPRIDDDGDVVFKKEGGTYFIQVLEKDETYFRLCFPNFWEIENDDERVRVQRACDHATGLTKAAKVFTVRDNVWATVEVFLGEPEQFRGIFARCMGALQGAIEHFTEKMKNP